MLLNMDHIDRSFKNNTLVTSINGYRCITIIDDFNFHAYSMPDTGRVHNSLNFWSYQDGGDIFDDCHDIYVLPVHSRKWEVLRYNSGKRVRQRRSLNNCCSYWMRVHL